jgi:hypothetical protein
MRAAVLALALVLPNAGLAQEWWQGIWAAEPEWCVSDGQIGAVNPRSIEITSGEMLGYENSCEISDLQELVNVDAVQFRVTCQSEGETYVGGRLLMRADTGASAIWMWFGVGDPIRFQRCE